MMDLQNKKITKEKLSSKLKNNIIVLRKQGEYRLKHKIHKGTPHNYIFFTIRMITYM